MSEDAHEISSPDKKEETIENAFIYSFTKIQERAYANSKDKGFWEVDIPLESDGSKIGLMHGELSEALEAIRHGNPPDDKIPEFNGAEAELADTIVRIMDYAGRRGLHVAEALIAKMYYNSTRPYKHGKKF